MNRSIIKGKSNNQITVSKTTWNFSTLSQFVIFLPFLLPHLQDLLAVLNALFLPGVKYSLHWCVAHPIIKAGEDPKASGTRHHQWGCSTSSTLIKRLEEERDLSKLRHFYKVLVKTKPGQSWPQEQKVCFSNLHEGRGESCSPFDLLFPSEPRMQSLSKTRSSGREFLAIDEMCLYLAPGFFFS